MKKFIVLLVLLLCAGSVGAWYWHNAGDHKHSYRTAAVKQGDLLATISATGTVEPEEVVDIGAQVAGQIDSFGQDPIDKKKTIDYGSAVEKDTILAHIDDTLYRSDAEQADAQLAQAKAGVERAKADLIQMRAKVYQADRDWKRAQQLRARGAIADVDYDTCQATAETAKSALGVGEAALVQAEKAVQQADAALRKAQKNLAYCTIKSPVKGVIVDRRVNIGQTVVSSLQAPSLFLIAKDLKRLQVWASVNEADIGQIHAGQPVTFTVDAYPGQVFQGTVNKIRLNATMTQNVVTYTVEVNTDNSNGKLLPYLTASLQFEVSKRNNVLLVPNAALRWLPQTDEIAPDAREAFTRSARGKESGAKAASAEKPGARRGTVWVEDGNYVRPVKVTVGLTDNTQTEIMGEGVNEGMLVVIGEGQQDSAANNGVTNPFAPKMFGGSKSR
jgi:HlyD family secretion protein